MNSHQVFLSLHESLKIATDIYNQDRLTKILEHTLAVMDAKLVANEIGLAYFPAASDYWDKPKTLDIYITDIDEGKALNLQSRNKDYATNVLSYPSDLPVDLLQVLPEISLGELILCHNVVESEALAQKKTFENHLTHLIVHGILHLLGFDHEISEADADQMEEFEIEILAGLGIGNPYATS